MNFKKLITTCSIITVLSGAAVPAYAGDNLLGGLIGATGGAAVGSNVGKGKGRIAAIAVGTLLGAGLGSQIASVSAYAHDNRRHRNCDNDYNRYNTGYYNTYYQPSPSYWAPEYRTQAVQVNTYQPQQEEYCREFNQGITIGGKVQPGYGTACLQPDGSWQIKK